MNIPRLAPLLAVALLGAAAAMAQTGTEGLPGSPLSNTGSIAGAGPAPQRGIPGGASFEQGRPVAFLADEVEYDRERNQVRARGNIVAWQSVTAPTRPGAPGAAPLAGERILRADEMIYDRTTEVAVLRGNVQLLEPDGQVFFADEAELGEGFRDAVLSGVRAIMAQNARMVANGARRSGGEMTDLSRVVYSSCNLCESDPSRPPLWQMRARVATQDRTAQRIAYRDAQLQIGGVPLFYTPFLSHPDPSTPRASGFLFPTSGITRFLGPFVATPYFWAIDEQSDLTITPLVSTRQLPNLATEYRRLFNNGEVKAQGSVGYLNDNTNASTPVGTAGHIFSRGRFNLDENWRVGFDGNWASSEQYLRTYRFEYRRVLASQVFAEGFWGTEGYARIDSRYYQGLRATDNVSQTPIVAPNGFYEYAAPRRFAGGWLTVDGGVLGITRTIGSFSQRGASRIAWQRPVIDPVGGVWTVRMQSDLRAYTAGGQEKAPIYLPMANGGSGDGNIRAALDWRYPFVRQGFGTQIIEPRVQMVTGPQTGNQLNIPNEDSVDFEFTEASLFQLNRFTGRDRQEGGSRVDAALRGAWAFPNGSRVEAISGRSYRFSEQSAFPAGSGVDTRASDWVNRVTFSPVSWVDIIGRTRLNGQTGQHRATDAISLFNLGNVGPFRGVNVSAGYYYYAPPQTFLTNPFVQNEFSAGFGASLPMPGGGAWRGNVSARYSLALERPALIQGSFGYEDECFILEGRFIRRFGVDPTTGGQYPGNTVLLIRLGFKTVGDYFFRAI